jgi:hypothetical protein
MQPMPVRALQQPILQERSRRGERRRHAALPALVWSRPANPAAEDWMAVYPCTRMHGAAFEAEFYTADDAI